MKYININHTRHTSQSTNKRTYFFLQLRPIVALLLAAVVATNRIYEKGKYNRAVITPSTDIMIFKLIFLFVTYLNLLQFNSMVYCT